MPCDYKLYHPDWKNISKDIRFNRAGNKCENCGLANGEIGVRRKDGSFYIPSGMELEAMWIDGEKTTKIVLTVAHLDHDKSNNDY
jgi:hypothetical protein